MKFKQNSNEIISGFHLVLSLSLFAVDDVAVVDVVNAQHTQSQYNCIDKDKNRFQFARYGASAWIARVHYQDFSKTVRYYYVDCVMSKRGKQVSRTKTNKQTNEQRMIEKKEMKHREKWEKWKHKLICCLDEWTLPFLLLRWRWPRRNTLFLLLLLLLLPILRRLLFVRRTFFRLTMPSIGIEPLPPPTPPPLSAYVSLIVRILAIFVDSILLWWCCWWWWLLYCCRCASKLIWCFPLWPSSSVGQK